MRHIGKASWVRESLDDAVRGKRTVIPAPAIATMGTPATGEKFAMLGESRKPGTVFMMGDNPDLPRMPDRPTLGDFFRLRLEAGSAAHLLQSAKLALERGLEEHEALRFFADESVGYSYPEAYIDFFGPDYDPPEYIHQEHREARKHR
jgi:hypothetical protein